MADAAKPAAPIGQGGSMTKELGKRGLDEGEDGGKPKKPTKPAPSSGRSLGRAIIVAALFMMIAWVFDSVAQPRYVLAPVQTNDNTFMYRLDQRTGVVHFCSTQQCVELPVK